MNYQKCPFNDNQPCRKNNDPEEGCPAWMELVETNVETQQERITKCCVFAYFPRLVVELIKSANRPAAAVEGFRNEIVQGFQVLAMSLPQFPAQLSAAGKHEHLQPSGYLGAVMIPDETAKD